MATEVLSARILPVTPENEYWFAEGCHILELSNGMHDEALSIARARVAAGSVTRWHRLHGITERYVIESGTGIVEIEGLTPQAVSPGDVAIIPAGRRQRICNNGTQDLRFLALCTPRFVPDAYEDVDTPRNGSV